MTTKININDAEYELDTALAEKAGYLKKVHPPITNIQVGDVYKGYSMGVMLVISSWNHTGWSLVGLDGGLQAFSDHQNLSKEALIDFLNFNRCWLVKNINHKIIELLEKENS